MNYSGKKILRRITRTDYVTIIAIKTKKDFKRYFNDSLVSLSPKKSNAYANSLNSLHYFSILPFGLNDKAVHKKLMGWTQIKGKKFYKVEIRFDEKNGGDDFEDVYFYWFDKESFKPKYLAYKFYTNGVVSVLEKRTMKGM